MQLITIKISKTRDKSPYNIYYKEDIKCLQQSDIVDNDWLEFLKPMADYIAQELFIK